MTIIHIERDFILSCNTVKKEKYKTIIQMFCQPAATITSCTVASLYDVCD